MMTDRMPVFDFDELFGEDYIYFYEQSLTAERTQREADVIWRLVGLEAGLAVLDVGCGHGRISNALAERGARVTGLDASSYFLDMARRDANARGLDTIFVQGDMRSLEWVNTFEAVLIWFTTFGYFSDDDNARVATCAARTLRPGGRLLIEQINRYALLRGGLPSSHVVTRDDDLMIDHVHYDALADRSVTERIVVRGGKVERSKFSIRLYSPAELTRLLGEAGFRSFAVFGQDGQPFTLYGNRMIVVGTM
jgi:SAM-dependent methyltransferase